MKDFKAVIFDMDGVIFDTEKLYLDCCVEIGEKYELEHVEEACFRCIGITSEASARIMYEVFGNDFPLDSFRGEVDELFRARFDERLPIKPGVRELLTYLKGEGYKVAIASSTKKESVKKELAQAKFLDFFDEIICGDMVERSKPNPDIFLKAAECLGVAPDSCIVIEDSYNGIRAASAAGMFSFMVPDMLKPDDEMRSKASVILDSLMDVKEYMRHKCQKSNCVPACRKSSLTL